MDIEKLTQSQLIMLAAFVSFMTSISTGIVTVALMQQAPPAITQSVSKVVEHTVERVVSGTAAAAAPQVKTVVVKENASLTQAVTAILPSVVRLYTVGEAPELLALGLVVNAEGSIVTDASALHEATHVTVDTQTGLHVPFAVTGVNSAGVAYLKPATTSVNAWQPASISSENSGLGESVVSISGKTVKLFPGVVVAFSADDKKAQLIETNIVTDGVLAGSPLVDSDGVVVGIATDDALRAGVGRFLTSKNILVPLKESQPNDPAKENATSSSIIQ